MTTSGDKRLGRRLAVAGLGAAVAAAATGVARSTGAQGSPAAQERAPARVRAEPRERPSLLAAHALREPGPDVQALFGPLAAGSPVGRHWTLAAVYAVRGGAIPVVLRTASGRRFGAEVFLAGGDDALASAGPLGLYLVNRGDGSRPTDEAAGLGVRALADALRARLEAGAPVPSALTTLAERRRRHPAGVFHIPA